MATAIDLFCGCGGLSKGLTDAGIEVLCGIDVWDKAIETYKKNLNHYAICSDLTKLQPEDVAREIGTRDIDIIAGGPPCQGFSIAGRRDSKDPRNSLFMEYIRFVKYFKPKLILMENVQGILSMKNASGESVKDIIIEEFRKAGYKIEYKTLLAADYEVPQIRKRVIFIGRPLHSDSEISHPPPVLTTENHIPVSSVLFNIDDVPRSYFLSEKAIAGIEKKKQVMASKGYGFGAQYLKLNKPCYTIPARYYKDGYDALVKYDDKNIRRLTEREVARVQSFPDSYEFVGNKKEVYMQNGNAVPCKLGYHLGKHLSYLLSQ